MPLLPARAVAVATFLALGAGIARPLALGAQAGDRAAAPAPAEPDPCASAAGWNTPQRPFRVYGNTYYVGTRCLAAVLVTSPAGHVLLDAGLPESAPLVLDNIRALGFRATDVKLLLNSHAHFEPPRLSRRLIYLSATRSAWATWSR